MSVKPATGRREQRKHPRRKVALEVSLISRGTKAVGQLLLDASDLSEGGAFVRSELLLEEGEALALEIKLPGRVIRSQGRVVRADLGPEGESGMGIQFVNLAEADRQALVLGLMALSATRA